MSSSMAESLDFHPVAEEDLLRAHLYRLLARFLSAPPSRENLEFAARMSGDGTDLGKAIAGLGAVAKGQSAEAIVQEYHDLFIGVGRGELVPYASYYLTGFLNEKPLARLRRDMTRLGLRRSDSSKEPEDHIAALMDMMAALIDGARGEPAGLGTQRDFYRAHIGTWARHFFTDLEGAKSSVLYATLGQVGRIFMDIEEFAFAMD